MPSCLLRIVVVILALILLSDFSSSCFAASAQRPYIVLACTHHKGHLLPMQIIARELILRDFAEVGFAVPAWVRDSEIPQGAFRVDGGNPSITEAEEEQQTKRAFEERDFSLAIQAVNAIYNAMFPALSKSFASRKPDLVLLDSIAFGAIDAAELHDVPSLFYSPGHFFLQSGALKDLSVPLYAPFFNFLSMSIVPMHEANPFMRTLVWIAQPLISLLFPTGVRNEARQSFGMAAVSGGFFGASEWSRRCLFLSSSFPSFEPSYPLPPNFIHTGPLVERNLSIGAIPQEYETFLGSSESFVLVSMGSMVHPNRETTLLFLGAFRLLAPQNIKVIWSLKPSSQDLIADQQLPENLFVSAWIPQSALLHDHRARAFLSHCGMNGINEALTYSVPTLCIPFMGDQFANAYLASQMGTAISLNRFVTTSQEIFDSLMRLVQEDHFLAACHQASAFISRFYPGQQRVVDYLEHFAHLNFTWDTLLPYPARETWPSWKMLNLDIYAIVSGAVILLFLSLRSLVRLLRRCWSSAYHQKSD